MDDETLTEAEALLDAVDRAEAPSFAPADLPAPLETFATRCQVLWALIHARQEAGETGEALDRPHLAMARLALLAWPRDAYLRDAYLRPMRARPDDDPVKQRYLAFEARVEAARAAAARARQAYLDRYVSPGSFGLELLEGAEARRLAYRTDPLRGRATLAFHLAQPGRVDFLVYSEPLFEGGRLSHYLDILAPDPETGPRARFDVGGLWGRYEAGEESCYAHGHEEGDTHDRAVVWGEWVLRKVGALLRDAGYPGTPPPGP